tara:strand:- start:15334 stop:16092 length:759 start_codon:yes stop_codon:yes gene_type:complete
MHTPLRHEQQYGLGLDLTDKALEDKVPDELQPAPRSLSEEVDHLLYSLDDFLQQFDSSQPRRQPKVRQLPNYQALPRVGKEKYFAPSLTLIQRRHMLLQTMTDVTWIERLGAEDLLEALYGYQLADLEDAVALRRETPSTDPAIQAVWEEMASLMDWSDDQITVLAYRMIEGQLETVRNTLKVTEKSESEAERDTVGSQELAHILSWIDGRIGRHTGALLEFGDFCHIAEMDEEVLHEGLLEILKNCGRDSW